MQQSSLARSFVIALAVSYLICSLTALVTREPQACSWAEAKGLRAEGDRYQVQHLYLSAAQSYLLATRYVSNCRTQNAAMFAVRSLTDAGTSYIRGKYMVALLNVSESESYISTSTAAYEQTARDEVSAINIYGHITVALAAVNRSVVARSL